VAYTPPGEPYALVTTDLNGDGRLDLLVIERQNDVRSLELLTNTGSGAFSRSASTVAIDPNPDALIAADLDGARWAGAPAHHRLPVASLVTSAVSRPAASFANAATWVRTPSMPKVAKAGGETVMPSACSQGPLGRPVPSRLSPATGTHRSRQKIAKNPYMDRHSRFIDEDTGQIYGFPWDQIAVSKRRHRPASRCRTTR
jgi:hypothetical protein